jgi:hypothetical protein
MHFLHSTSISKKFAEHLKKLFDCGNNGAALSYDPLDPGSIRLLTIQQTGGKIVCRLKNYSIDNTPPFYALSYVWGTDLPSKTIDCNGVAFPITPNLLSALSDLHLQVPTHPVWVDAICINQKDDVEKAKQIPLMSKIYNSAQTVVIWLGPSTSDNEGAMNSIRSLNLTFERSDKSLFRGYTIEKHDSLVSHGFPPLDHPTWPALIRLLNHDWFSRLWVVQEAILAQSLVLLCGTIKIEWQELVRFVVEMDALYDLMNHIMESNSIIERADKGSNAVRSIQAIRTTISEQGFANPLYILNVTRNKLCKEPVDKVYGLLALMAPAVSDLVVVDYSPASRNNYWALYARFFKLLLRNQGLDAFGLTPSTSRHPSLPSWCPDLSQPCSMESVSWQFSKDKPNNLFEMSSVPSLPKTGYHAQILAVNGIAMDRVVSVFNLRWDNEMDAYMHRKHAHHMRDCEQHCLALSKDVYGHDDTPVEHVRTLVRGGRYERVGLPRLRDDELPQAYSDTLTWLSLAERTSSHKHPPSALARCYIASMEMTWIGSSFFTTENGHIGIGANTTQPGDYICIFHNGNCPHILRLLPGLNLYKLHGETYVDGLMDGRAFKARDPLRNYKRFLIA